MSRLLQLFLALAALGTGLWLLYGGYEREVSLAGKTEMGLVILKTGVDGRTRVLTHHWYYGAGVILITGSTWWLVKGGPKRAKRRR